jgi:hypothetical protein
MLLAIVSGRFLRASSTGHDSDVVPHREGSDHEEHEEHEVATGHSQFYEPPAHLSWGLTNPAARIPDRESCSPKNLQFFMFFVVASF